MAVTCQHRIVSTVLASVLSLLLLAVCIVGLNQPQTFNRIQEQPGPGPDEEACMQFLQLYLPQRDQGTLDVSYLRQNTEIAIHARVDNSWSEAVPDEIFLEYVLPHAVLDEQRDNWRQLFYTLFKPMVSKAKTVSEAAQILNRDIWKIWGIYFKPDQSPEILSPSQVIAAGYASCTGLSIFLVDACRSVGIPARLAGTPSWKATSLPRAEGDPERWNNHNWVEVWDGGVWSFTGAAEYNPDGFNQTWFYPEPIRHQIPGDFLHAVYAAAYKSTPGLHFPLVWNQTDESIPGYDVTTNYLVPDLEVA